MKYFNLSILSLMLFSGSYLFAQTKSANDTLHWRNSKPLSWEDFKGKPKTGMSGEAYCQLEANYEKPNPLKKTKFKIAAVWDKKKSWIAPAAKTSDELLYYQVLFNIYEAHARKLRKEFSETKFGLKPEEEFRGKYNAASEDLTQESDSYKEETNDGTDKDAVKKWNDKINEELKQLGQFTE